MIPKIEDTDDIQDLIEQINKRIDLMEREFALKTDLKIELKEIRSLDNRPSVDQQEKELRMRDNKGTIQLALKDGGRLHTIDLTKEDI